MSDLILSLKEKEILQLLMDANQPMTAHQLTEFDPSLKKNTVLGVFRKLLDNKFIKVNNIVYSGCVLCRNYLPTKKAHDYMMRDLKTSFDKVRKTNPTPAIFFNLLKDADAQTIAELEDMLQQVKKS